MASLACPNHPRNTPHLAGTLYQAEYPEGEYLFTTEKGGDCEGV